MEENRCITTGELVRDKTQVYLTNISDDLVKEIFNNVNNEYVFRHTDCPIVFTTDGYFLYSEDMDELNVDPVEKYGLYNIIHVYNNFQEFLDTFKAIENLLGRELYLSDWYNNQDCSIRTLELEFACSTAIAMQELINK